MNLFKIEKEDNEGMSIGKAIMATSIISLAIIGLIEIGFIIYLIIN